ncbi:MAG: Gldg family protein [Clostridia bacterium]|nr:Gldg family protein [Clostridia bacterium]
MKKMNVNKRNLKYGGFAVVLTALIIVAVILLNAAVTALGSAFSWYIDLTGSSVYSVSDEFYDHVDELMDVNSDNDPENDLYLNIVLLMEKDAFRDYNAYTYYVYHTINQITANCEYINLEYINSIQNPELVQDRYMKISGDTPAITDVIVEIAEKGEDGEFVSRSDLGFKKHAINSFYMADSESNSIIGYNAETKFLSAIAQLAGKVGEETSPTVYYLQGHSEPTLDEADDWKKLFEDAGYIVKETNLLSEDFPEKITKGSLVFINCPKTDLSASTSSGVSEIKKLRAFAATSYGNVIVTLDSSSTAASLPTLDALMSEWGVGIGGGITDDEHSVSGSGAVRVLADYSLTKTSIAKSIINKATGTNENRAPTLFTNPRAILVYDNSKIVSPTNSAAACEVLLAPYSSAKVSGTTPANAQVALASITRIIANVSEPEDTTHYVMCIGSSDFVDPELDKTNYNKMLVYQALYVMWSGAMTFDDITYKKFDDNALTVTTEQTNAWTIACVAVIPAAFIIAGTVVWVRRRHS